MAEIDNGDPQRPDIAVLEERMKSLDDLVALAQSGDAWAAARLLNDFIIRARLDEPPPKKVIDWLCETFTDVIVNKTSADVALGLKPRARGRQKMNIEKQHREVQIAEWIAREIYCGKSIDAAVTDAATTYLVSESTAKKAYFNHK